MIHYISFECFHHPATRQINKISILNIIKGKNIFLALNLIYLSKGYIHRYLTGPQIFASSAKCTTRCIIDTKNEGGKYFSNTHNVSTMLSFIFISSSRFITFEHKTLKNIDNCRIAARNGFCDSNAYINITGSSCCMRM